MRNEEVMRSTRASENTVMIEDCGLKWFNHVERMSRERFHRYIMKWKPSDKTKKGRLQVMWRWLLKQRG